MDIDFQSEGNRETEIKRMRQKQEDKGLEINDRNA